MPAEHGNYIGGEWVESDAADTFEVVNLVNTTEVVSRFQKSTTADVEVAIQAANESEDK